MSDLLTSHHIDLFCNLDGDSRHASGIKKMGLQKPMGGVTAAVSIFYREPSCDILMTSLDRHLINFLSSTQSCRSSYTTKLSSSCQEAELNI